jgi:predicted XRE-type DNA-binding protein
VKIRTVKANNHKKAFEVKTWRCEYDFPYARLDVKPSKDNPVGHVYVDEELGKEAFTYVLKSGQEGTVHIDHVLEYNQDPTYMRDLLLYKLTVEAGKRVKQSGISKRELIRRLGTSPSQFYRILDTGNYRKSIDQVVALLHVLDCEIDLSVRQPAACDRLKSGGGDQRQDSRRVA